MSDIPYSVRDWNVRVNTIRGFNFADINTNEMFKKVDDNNVGGINVFATQTSTTNKLTMLAGTGLLAQTVGTIEGVTDLFTRSLHLNTFGDRNQGITIREDGISSRVGIGITQPEEDLEIDGNIQIDSANVARLKFKKSGNPATAHALGEIDGEEDENNGGALQFFTKVDGSPSVTEKLRINNIGAIGIGGANYGAAGAVLTSNGLGAAVSWIAPVYVSARKNTDTVITLPANTTTYAYINGMTVEFSSGYVYDASTGEFTAPRTAIYIIDYAIHISDDVPIFQEFLSALVSVNRGSGFVREMEQINNDSGKETKYITLKSNYMTQLNAGDKVKSELEMYSGPANTTTIRGNSFKPRCTFQSIHSIT